MATLSFTVDDSGLVRAFHAVEDAVGSVVQRIAEDFAEDVAADAGQRSTRLREPWEISGEGPTERHVVAPEWWAHLLAHGTAAHGPNSAPHLAFFVDGQAVFAKHVSGIAGDPFDERAAERTRSRVDDILERAIAEVT